MADINVERKSSMAWLWWLLALLAIALIAWLLLAGDDEEEVAVTDPAAVVAPVGDTMAQPMAPAAATTSPALTEVMANPSAYYGQSFTLESANVAEVVGDRGFWVESQGQRIFVVKNESPQPGVADVQGAADTRAARNVNAGETLRINGTLHDATNLDAVQPPLDAQTRQILQGQQVFIQANVADIQHM